MKKQVLFTILAMLVSVSAFSHDIEVANADGVTIYYYYRNNDTELAVTYRGKYNEYSNEYQGNVVIPASVSYSGKTYPVTSIGNYAFRYCDGLTSVTIPNSVTSIGYEAFRGCKSLTSVTIPNSVTSIGNYAFRYCDGLISIKVEDGNPKYDSRNNCNAIIETETNALIVGCQNTIIPNSVTSIGDFAFYECSSLISVTIPNSVTSIGGGAFYGCSGLTSVTIGNSVTSIGGGAFYGCSLKSFTVHNNRPPVADSNITSQEVYDNCVLYVPEGSENAYYAADGWKYFKNIQTIGAVEKVPQDVNGDGIVDTQDVLEIYQYIQEH